MSKQSLVASMVSTQDTLSRVQLTKTTNEKIPYLYKETFGFFSMIDDREQRKKNAETYLELFNNMFDIASSQFEQITGNQNPHLDHHKGKFGRTAAVPLLNMFSGRLGSARPFLIAEHGYIEASLFFGIKMVELNPELELDYKTYVPAFGWHWGVTGVETDINDPTAVVHRQIISHVGCLND